MRAAQKTPARIEARGTAHNIYEIDVFGPIGGYDGVSASAFKRVLEAAGGATTVVVNLNSPGGDVFDGIAIHNMLAQHDADIEVRVFGLAASAASVIAIGGDKILMGEGSFFMIHNAWTFALGDTRELAKISDTLSRIDGELAKAYATHSGLDVAEIKDLMDAETWFGADEAIENGFADGTFDVPSEAQNAFDLSAFKNVPKALVKKGPKRSAKASKPAALPTPQAEDFLPLRAELERLKGLLSTN